MNRLFLLALATAATSVTCSAASAEQKYRAEPFAFVGNAGACGTNYPAGSNIVTSGWLGGMGLPDDSGGRDNREGLLLNKNGPTADCSAAGASIRQWKKGTPLTELGFDYRVGGHCGAGAPRFNVTTSTGAFYFVGGCQAGAHSATSDPQWERVRFGTADFFGSPPFVMGTAVDSIEIIFDEGTDSTSASDPTGVGLAVIDNIDINSYLITNGGGDIKH